MWQRVFGFHVPLGQQTILLSQQLPIGHNLLHISHLLGKAGREDHLYSNLKVTNYELSNNYIYLQEYLCTHDRIYNLKMSSWNNFIHVRLFWIQGYRFRYWYNDIIIKVVSWVMNRWSTFTFCFQKQEKGYFECQRQEKLLKV